MNYPKLSFFALSILLSSVGLVIYGEYSAPKKNLPKPLSEILPDAHGGWIRRPQSIADTPEQQNAVTEVLNFDDCAVFAYYSPKTRISVYVAYWAPGKMPPRLVASHTPDSCWIGSGWECIEQAPISYPQGFRRLGLPSGQERTFRMKDVIEFVWFWHIVDKESIPVGKTANYPWYGIFADILKSGISQRKEQFFIRISSNNQLSDPANSEQVKEIIESLFRFIKSS